MITNLLRKKSRYTFLIILLGLLGCKDSEKESNTLSGKLTIIADESFLSILNAEAKVFQYVYEDAVVSSSSMPEANAITQFIKGTTDAVVVSRDLSVSEKEILKKNNVRPQSYTIASDGLALIVHKDRQDSSLTLTQLQEIASGSIREWQDLGSRDKGEIVLTFDLNNSSNLLFFHQKFPLTTEKVNVLAAGSNLKVMEYVKQHKNAIGIISLSAISDDPFSNEHLKNIKVLSLEGSDGKQYLPWQENLATGKYPLKRDIILLNRYKSGLGTGFASFLLSDDGQRIILKAGLLPVKMPGREVIFNK